MYNHTADTVEYWTYEADIHCDACARKRWGKALDAGLADDLDFPMDREGNYVMPVFDAEPARRHCGTCHRQIKEERSDARALADLYGQVLHTSHPLGYDTENLPDGFWLTVESTYVLYWGTIDYEYDSDPVSTAIDMAAVKWARDTLTMNREQEAAQYDRDLLQEIGRQS
mgnify:FL=1